MKNRVCGESSFKHRVCKECKARLPFRPSGKGDMPFNRKVLIKNEGMADRLYATERKPNNIDLSNIGV